MKNILIKSPSLDYPVPSNIIFWGDSTKPSSYLTRNQTRGRSVMLIFQKGKHGPDKFNTVRLSNAPRNSQLARASATVQVNHSVFNAGPIAQVSVLLFHFNIPTNYSDSNPYQTPLKTPWSQSAINRIDTCPPSSARLTKLVVSSQYGAYEKHRVLGIKPNSHTYKLVSIQTNCQR